MRTVAIRTACWLRALLFACAAFLIAVGLSIVWSDGDRAGRMVAMTMLIGGGCFLGSVAFTRRPRIVLEERGIRVGLWGVVEWCDITDAFLRKIGRSTHLCLQVADRDKYVERLSPHLRRLGRLGWLSFGDVSVSVTGLTVSSTRLVAFILRRLRAKPCGAPSNRGFSRRAAPAAEFLDR